MLNNVRSRVSATGSVVVAGTLSRGQYSETRGRRIGGNEITDSFRQIFGPPASLPELDGLTDNRQCNEVISFDTFVKSNNFKHMIEDVAKLKGVQEVVFKHIPITMFEKDKGAAAALTSQKDKLSIESGNDSYHSEDEVPAIDKLEWSLIGDELSENNNCKESTEEVGSSGAAEEEEAINRKEFEELKEEKEDQVSIHICQMMRA